jgi:sec-independent protein translocase protein TatC
MRTILRGLWLVLSWPFRIGIASFRRIKHSYQSFFLEEPEDIPIGDTVQKAVENPGDLLVHLAALRGHLLRSVLALLLVSAALFSIAPSLLDWLATPIGGISQLQAVEVTEPVGVVMRIVLVGAFALTLPYIIFELVLFAAPGLSRRSRFIGIFSIPLVSLLFFAGMGFAYYIILPRAIPFLLSFMDIPTLVRPSSYVSFATGIMFWIGIAFEFPLVSYVLASMGILSPEILMKQWRLAVVLLSVLAAAITPTIDPVNMLLVWVPLVILYFLSVISARLARTQRTRRRDSSSIS